MSEKKEIPEWINNAVNEWFEDKSFSITLKENIAKHAPSYSSGDVERLVEFATNAMLAMPVIRKMLEVKGMSIAHVVASDFEQQGVEALKPFQKEKL